MAVLPGATARGNPAGWPQRSLLQQVEPPSDFPNRKLRN